MSKSVISKIIDNSIYSKPALSETRQAFKEYCSVNAVPIANQQVKLLININDKYQDNKREIVLEFMNFLLDLSAQKHINN